MVLFKSREEHEMFIIQMLKNVTCDEIAFNIDNKPGIPNVETAYTLILEELTETEEALSITKQKLQEFFTLIRLNKDTHETNKHLKLIAFTALDIMQEAMHTRAVALKAIQQLEKEKAPTDGNQ